MSKTLLVNFILTYNLVSKLLNHFNAARHLTQIQNVIMCSMNYFTYPVVVRMLKSTQQSSSLQCFASDRHNAVPYSPWAY